LSNFIASADVPMVTVGRDLRIRRMTSAAQRAFNLLQTDVGPLDRAIKFSVGLKNVVGVIDNRRRVDAAVAVSARSTTRTAAGGSVRVRPFVTADNRIDGATLVAVDIDSIRRTREITEARDYALAVVQTVRGPLSCLTPNAPRRPGERRVSTACSATTRVMLEGRRLWEARASVWNDLELRRHLMAACAAGNPSPTWKIIRNIPPIGDRTLVLNARAIRA
jgi:two-component system CheB/CheR fusion protein